MSAGQKTIQKQTTTKSTRPRGTTKVVPAKPTRSLTIANKGIRNDRDFASLMSALMSDLIDGSINPKVANATVNAGGKLLKVVEMRMRWGVPTPAGNDRTLQLTL